MQLHQRAGRAGQGRHRRPVGVALTGAERGALRSIALGAAVRFSVSLAMRAQPSRCPLALRFRQDRLGSPKLSVALLYMNDPFRS
jgi:hypothetical protein